MLLSAIVLAFGGKPKTLKKKKLSSFVNRETEGDEAYVEAVL